MIVAGRLRQRTFTTRAGDTSTVIELDAAEVGRVAAFCSPKFMKATNAAGTPAT